MSEQMWKAMRAGLTSQYDGSKWEIGTWRKVPGVTQICVGLNASPRIIDTMQYVHMEIVARVEARGIIIRDTDKCTCSQMRVVEAWHWPKEESVRLAVFCAELVLKNFERIYPDDNRPRQAIEAAKSWLENPSAESAESARSAARSAESAESAASAAWSAESAESAASAAWSAASAAWSAESAAWSAESAAWSAESARSAARSAESAAGSAEILDKIEAYIQSRIPHLEKYEEAKS